MGQAAWGAEAAVAPMAVEAMAVVALVEHLPTVLGPTAPQPTGHSQLTVLVTGPLLQATLLQVRAAAWQLICTVGTLASPAGGVSLCTRPLNQM